jgi:hypothetical protein
MKRFEFGLERVRRWRHEQVDLEELKLRQLHSELNALISTRKSLETEAQAAQQAVRAGARVSAGDLHHLDVFKDYVRAESQKLEAQERLCETRIAPQRQRVIEALRQAELLDQLKAQKLADWRSVYQKEEEGMAAELFLAKRKRQ